MVHYLYQMYTFSSTPLTAVVIHSHCCVGILSLQPSLTPTSFCLSRERMTWKAVLVLNEKWSSISSSSSDVLLLPLTLYTQGLSVFAWGVRSQRKLLYISTFLQCLTLSDLLFVFYLILAAVWHDCILCKDFKVMVHGVTRMWTVDSVLSPGRDVVPGCRVFSKS